MRNVASSVVSRCLENHSTCYDFPEALRTDNDSNLVNHERDDFLGQLGIKNKKTIPLLQRANGQVERQNKSLLEAMRSAQPEGKQWQRE